MTKKKVMVYAILIMLIVSAIIAFVAVPALQKKKLRAGMQMFGIRETDDIIVVAYDDIRLKTCLLCGNMVMTG